MFEKLPTEDGKNYKTMFHLILCFNFSKKVAGLVLLSLLVFIDINLCKELIIKVKEQADRSGC